MRYHVVLSTRGALFRPTPETTAGDLATPALSVTGFEAGVLDVRTRETLSCALSSPLSRTTRSHARVSAPSSRFPRPAKTPAASRSCFTLPAAERRPQDACLTLPPIGNAIDPHLDPEGARSRQLQ
jgi:hypothetical protein